MTPGARLRAWVLATLLIAGAGVAEASQLRVEEALANIMALHRPGQDGLATAWDGNKYVQCRLMPERSLRCESAGSRMQSSLAHVLTPERIARLAALGWQLDPSFGNYVRIFPTGVPVKDAAEQILLALKEGYGSDPASLQISSDWITSEPCPPRNGPSQNLAGMINDAPAMATTAVRGCSYLPAPDDEPTTPLRKADLIKTYSTRVSGEIQRLRVNVDRPEFVYFVLETGAGYIQCGREPPRAVYCEAQSAESWPVLSRILTKERVARLNAAGYADPGRAPNYWKSYPLDVSSDAAIAEELLTLLHDVYGYDGMPRLRFLTEKGS
jgi:hypothetical protein